MPESFGSLHDKNSAHLTPVRDFVVLAIAAAILITFRLHAFSLPLETDECNYAYIGSRLLAGDRLYVDVWDHQPPGVFAMIAGVIAFFGNGPLVFRWLSMTFSLVSLLLLYAIARRIGGRSAGITAALLFALASSDPGAAGEGCNREIYMNTLILCAWWLALIALPVNPWQAPSPPLPFRERAGVRVESKETPKDFPSPNPLPNGERDFGSTHRSNFLVFLSGAALAIGSSIKTNVAIHWFFLCAVLILAAFRGRPASIAIRRTIATVLVFGLAPALLWAGTFAYFGATHRWREFIDAVFTFNLAYSDASQNVIQRFGQFFTPKRHPFVFESALALWLAGGGATLWLMIEFIRRRSVDSALVLALIFAGYVATCLPGWFWPHYYYLMIPSLALGSAVMIGRLADNALLMAAYEHVVLAKSGFRFLTSRIGPKWVVLTLAPLFLFVTEFSHYLDEPPFGITVKRYNSRDFWGKGQGEYVAKVTDPSDRIFVFGNDASIYYYSHRRCASRYTMITGLHAGYPGATERRKILLDELTRNPPRLILVLFNEKPWPEWKTFLQKDYGEPIGWDFRDGTKDEPIMFVLARKDQPVPQIDWNWDRSSVGGWIPRHRAPDSLER